MIKAFLTILSFFLICESSIANFSITDEFKPFENKRVRIICDQLDKQTDDPNLSPILNNLPEKYQWVATQKDNPPYLMNVSDPDGSMSISDVSFSIHVYDRETKELIGTIPDAKATRAFAFITIEGQNTNGEAAALVIDYQTRKTHSFGDWDGLSLRSSCRIEAIPEGEQTADAAVFVDADPSDS